MFIGRINLPEGVYMRRIYYIVACCFVFVLFSCSDPQGKPEQSSSNDTNKGTKKPISTVVTSNDLNLVATDFIGEMTSEAIYVLDSRLSWQKYDEASYYDVFIDGEKTNDEKITEPKKGSDSEFEFRTAFDGDVDVDSKMGNEPREVTIEVKAYGSNDKELAISKIVKTIPAKPSFSVMEINGEPFEKDIEVNNPVSIKIKLNNGIKLQDTDIDKAVSNLHNYVKLVQYGDDLLSDIDYDKEKGVITIKYLGALKGNKNHATGYQLKIGQNFSDRYRLWYTNAENTYNFKIAKITDPKNLEVEKILLNNDQSKNLMEKAINDVNVKSSVSIIFNQLIYLDSYTPSTAEQIAGKGRGIYITKNSTGKGDDDSRLINPKYEIIKDGDVSKTKVTFDMIGKSYYIEAPDPLEGKTTYYIVVDDDIKSGDNTSLENEVRKSFTTGEGIEKLYKLTVLKGIIKVNGKEVGTDTGSGIETDLAEGDEFTIVANDPPSGKVFAGWYHGVYYEPALTKQQKDSKELTLKMRDYDTTFTAEYK